MGQVSGKLESLDAIKGKMGDLRQEIHTRFDNLPVPFSVSDRGIFCGLFVDPEPIVTILYMLTEGLHPVKLSFGLGRGKITTEMNSDVWKMDGPCFQRARRAMQRASKRGRWVEVKGFDEPFDQMLYGLFSLQGAVRGGWTEKQNLYAHTSRAMLQKDVAGMFGISPSVVSQSLKSASFDAILEGEKATQSLLGLFYEKPQEVHV